MKKLFSAILVITLLISLFLTASAQSFLTDDAHLLSSKERADLSQLLEEYSNETGADISIMTIDCYQGNDIESYTESLCDGGLMSDGILLLVSMNTREYCLTKCGKIENAINDNGLDYIEDAFIPYLSEGEYYTAFCIFASLTADAITEYKVTGKIYGGDDFKPDIEISHDGKVIVTQGSRPLSHYVICVVIGLLLGLFSMFIMQRGMRTIKSRNLASDYIVHGSLSMRVSSDRFLYRTVTKTPKPQSNSSSGRGVSGGRSSSGRF